MKFPVLSRIQSFTTDKSLTLDCFQSRVNPIPTMSLNINFNPDHPTGYVPRYGGCGQDLHGLHVLGIRSLVCRVILPVVLYVCESWSRTFGRKTQTEGI